MSNSAFVRPLFDALRINVPRDLAFVDLFLTDFSGTTAGVRQNYEAVGALAVQIVARALSTSQRGIPEFPTTTFVEGTWFGGVSCPVISRSR
jgi:LacI family transcriptional regulator